MSQDGRKILADKIQKYRIASGYTREQLSLLVGKDNSYISKLEKYKINISIDMIEKLTIILNRKLSDFINIK